MNGGKVIELHSRIVDSRDEKGVEDEVDVEIVIMTKSFFYGYSIQKKMELFIMLMCSGFDQ